MNAAQVLADAAAKVAARHRDKGTAGQPDPGRPVTGLRFPRHTLGVYTTRLPRSDTGWDHRDSPVVDLSESRRRYDAGWVI